MPAFRLQPFQPMQQTTAAAKTPLERYGRLNVSGSSLVDSSGNPVQLKGISTHGLSWYPQYVNKKAFQTLRDQWGIEVIRLAMYTAEYNGYCTGSAKNRNELKALIDKAVQYCDQLGLYVIIDWHILSDSNPNIYKKQAASFFKSMAKKYAGHKNVLYEICNEPNGDTTWNQVKSYAQTMIRTIRRQDPHAIIITGTPTWCQDADIAAASPLKGSNLMYAFHFYASTHTDDYRKKLQSAIDSGLPVFVSEFGICEASGSGTINKAEASRWIRLLDKHQVSYVAWNLSNKDEASALLKSSCTKTSGWKRSDLSETGTWIYDMLRKRRL
ncbi:MAG: glycoside hydrolase family 5 protein [Eubacterium sp.]|nr:glycoside hydrolase family 5 protein [Eubacterium sp.]